MIGDRPIDGGGKALGIHFIRFRNPEGRFRDQNALDEMTPDYEISSLKELNNPMPESEYQAEIRRIASMQKAPDYAALDKVIAKAPSFQRNTGHNSSKTCSDTPPQTQIKAPRRSTTSGPGLHSHSATIKQPTTASSYA